MSETPWPFFGWVDDIRPMLADLQTADGPAALATIIATNGPAPRGVGTQMLFTANRMAGYFSGGCIEADVAIHARAVAIDGAPRHLVYGQGSPWLDIRLVCGGRIEILVERIAAEDSAVTALCAAAAERASVNWHSDGRIQAVKPASDQDAPFALKEHGGFVRRFDPPRRLLTVGGDPTALAIASLAAQSGFDSWLLCPNGPDTPPPLPDVHYRRSPLTESFAALGIDRWTAVAVASHELDIDHTALCAALSGQAAYIGVLGARARLDERWDRLRKAGFADAALNAIRAPIGIEGCGKAPWQIAVATMADILRAMNIAEP
jgi:xanthine dehydrogenase accessory factor